MTEFSDSVGKLVVHFNFLIVTKVCIYLYTFCSTHCVSRAAVSCRLSLSESVRADLVWFCSSPRQMMMSSSLGLSVSPCYIHLLGDILCSIWNEDNFAKYLWGQLFHMVQIMQGNNYNEKSLWYIATVIIVCLCYVEHYFFLLTVLIPLVLSVPAVNPKLFIFFNLVFFVYLTTSTSIFMHIYACLSTVPPVTVSQQWLC